MKKNGYGKILKDGIITQNPVLVQVLGMCPTLAVSTMLMNGLGMGVAVTAVLICSNLFISLLRKVIDKRIRIASFIVIIAGFVTMVEMVMKAYLPSLSESLGVYIPLIVVNCIILARAEAFASRNKPLPSVVDGLACGIGFTAAICIVSTIREVLGTGALLGYDFKLIPPIMIFTLAPGGLLVLGFVMAFCAWISNRRKKRAAAPAGNGEAVPAKPEKPAPAPKAEAPKAPVVPVAPSETQDARRGDYQAPAFPEKTSAAQAADVKDPAPEPVIEKTVDSSEPAPRNDAAVAEPAPEPTPEPTPEPVVEKAGDSSEPAPRNDAAVAEPEPAPADSKPAPAEQLTFDAVGEAPADGSALTEDAFAAEPTAEERAAMKRAYLNEKAEKAARGKKERKPFFSRLRRPEPETEDEPLEVPSFMSEPVTLMREKPEKEETDNG